MRRLVPDMAAIGLPWGPTGAVAFELATDAPVVNESSDLDIAVFIDDEIPAIVDEVREVHRLLAGVAVHVDCLVEYPWGGVALSELASGRTQLMARTLHGPRLIPAGRVVS
jgi:phosphoribosyl-dephospho-CoA transferase